MPWWTDPDSLTPPVSRARLLFVLARLFDQNLKQIALNKWAASAWHHPVRLSVHDDGDLLLHVESLYGPAFVTDAAALRAHIQATNFAHCLSSIRLVPTSAGHRILASSWTPLMLGAEGEQLRGILIISQQRHLAISLEIGSEPLVSLRARRISRQHTASLLAVGGLRVRLGVFP